MKHRHTYATILAADENFFFSVETLRQSHMTSPKSSEVHTYETMEIIFFSDFAKNRR